MSSTTSGSRQHAHGVVAFLQQVDADRDQAVRGERAEDPVGGLEAARPASAALANPAAWEIILVPEVHDWFIALDEISASLVRDSVGLLGRARSRARPTRSGPDHRLQAA
jgi:hypothetical protein